MYGGPEIGGSTVLAILVILIVGIVIYVVTAPYDKKIRIEENKRKVVPRIDISSTEKASSFIQKRHTLQPIELQEGEIEIGFMDNIYHGDPELVKELNNNIVFCKSFNDRWAESYKNLLYIRRAPTIKQKEKFPSPKERECKGGE